MLFLVVLSTALLWLATTEAPVRHSARAATPVPLMPERVSIAGAAVLGTKGARVALIEFSDFECPFSGTFARDLLPKLYDQYIESGQMCLVFMHLPLVSLHAHALAAAEAAECAGRSGRFWAMHHTLFQRQADIGRRSIRQLAADAGVAVDTAFDDCLCDVMTRARIADQTALAYDLGIQATPTFLLGPIADNWSVRVVRRFDRAPSFREVGDAIAAAIGSLEPVLPTTTEARAGRR